MSASSVDAMARASRRKSIDGPRRKSCHGFCISKMNRRFRQMVEMQKGRNKPGS